MVKNDNQELV